MMSYAICVLLLGLGLGMVLAKCPTPNEVDSYDSRFQWGAHVNGDEADRLLDPSNLNPVKTNSAPNVVRLNLKLSYAALKLQEVMIETRNVVLVKLQDYNLKNEPDNGWQQTRFTFLDEDELAYHVVFLLTGPAGKVEVRKVYVKGCLQINPCSSYLNKEFESLMHDIYLSMKLQDTLAIAQYLADTVFVMRDGDPSAQGVKNVLQLYQDNPDVVITHLETIQFLRAVQLSENRVYTVHLIIHYKADRHTLREPTKRILTIWNKGEENWIIDVVSINSGPPVEA